MKKLSLIERIVRAIIRTRLEPMEVILSLSAVLHGIWLFVPFWGFARNSPGTVSGQLRLSEIVIATALVTLGTLHFTAMAFGWPKQRTNIAFMKFMVWMFIAWLAFLATSAASIVWLSYLTIAFVSGAVYLNISSREIDPGDDR